MLLCFVSREHHDPIWLAKLTRQQAPDDRLAERARASGNQNTLAVEHYVLKRSRA
jgi:hypothetical protein